MKVKIAVIVLEGIILNTRPLLERFIQKEIDENFKLPDETFNFYDIVESITNPEKIIEKFYSEEEWKKAEIFSGVKESLEILKNNDFKVFLISRIEKHSQDEIENHLKEKGLQFDAFIATGLNQSKNPFSFYMDVLTPKIFVASSLYATGNLKNRGNLKIIYANPLNSEDNSHSNITQAKSLAHYLEKYPNDLL